MEVEPKGGDNLLTRSIMETGPKSSFRYVLGQFSGRTCVIRLEDGRNDLLCADGYT